MAEKSWRWYLLGEKWDRPQQQQNHADNTKRPTQEPPIKIVPSDSDITEKCAADERHRAEERKFRCRQLIAAWALIFLTFTASGVAIVGLIFLWRSIVEANRAWVEPFNAVIEMPIQEGKGIEIIVQYLNVGRSPALNLTKTHIESLVPIETWNHIGPDLAAFSDACLRQTQITNQQPVSVSYPSVGPNYTLHFKTDNDGEVNKVAAPKEFTTQVLLVQGFFVPKLFQRPAQCLLLLLAR